MFAYLNQRPATLINGRIDISMARRRRNHWATQELTTKGRQDEPDLQDGFCLGPAGAMHSFQTKLISSSIPPIRFILS
jgi:hypothetical protein